MKAINYIFLFFFMLHVVAVNAQSERTLAKKGNSLYEEKKYDAAELHYRKSLEKNNDYEAGKFNLGDALYQQGKYEEAATQFEQIAQKNTNSATAAKAYHNLGNAYLKSKKYKEGVEAYKKALKQNPSDNDTRHNLSYAMAKLQQQQQQNKDKKDDKKDDKKEDKKDEKDKKEGDKKDDKKEGDKKEDKKEDKESDDKKDGKESDQKPAKPDPKKITEGDAKRMLEALNQQEKNVQKKLSKKDAQQVEVDKNW